MKLVQNLKKNIYSGDNLVSFSDMRYLPRWVILIIDVMLLCAALSAAYYILKMLGIPAFTYLQPYAKYMLVISVNVIFMYLFKTYAGIIRHSTFLDLFKLFLAGFSTFITLVAINMGVYWLQGIKLIRNPVLILYAVISLFFLFLFRLFVKEFFYFIREFTRTNTRRRVLVLGIDDKSIAIARAVMDNPSLPYKLAGFLTQRGDSGKAKLLGKNIYTKKSLEQTDKEDLNYDGVIIIREAMTKEETNMWVNLFLEKGLRVFKAPSVQKLRKNDISTSIKNLQIEDLLNRRPIKIDNEEVKRRHFQKTVLVTGGAGSIGSEIVRQVAQFEPLQIIVLDQAETPLYEIEMEMREKYPNQRFKFVMQDVANYDRLEDLFKTYEFSMVYHAAAYKHVPLVEENPHEAIFTNVLGSKNVAMLSSKYKVNRFVMVSTDKAVNPTNVMGATKRTAELFVQSLQNLEGNTTKFITTRFGNVLGSNGSVIPLFKRQIENGGPVTITHPDIVRYFMTIPEACELVLQAGTMGRGGEVFVFDMGEPVKIIDLAKRMIRLSGYEPDQDIKIAFTGLRPGEKLYEELLSDDAKTLPTPNEKIMISKDPHMAFAQIDELVKQLVKSTGQNKVDVVRVLKQIVPEFKSNNSIYEMLD